MQFVLQFGVALRSLKSTRTVALTSGLGLALTPSRVCGLSKPCLPAPDVSILGSYCPDLLQFSLSTSRGFGEVAIKGTMLNPAWGRNVLLGKVRYFRDMQHPGKCNILKSDMSGENLGNNPENFSRKLFKFKTSPFVVSRHIRIERVKCRTQF